MGHTYTSTVYHCVFSTKERTHIIPPDLLPRLWEFIGGIARRNGMTSIRAGGTTNHLHIVLIVPPTLTLSKAMQLIKAGSSKWINDHPGARFEWQQGYSAFSIGASQVARTIAYIEGQEEHHKKVSFEKEYLAFLERHGIQFDRKYVLG